MKPCGHVTCKACTDTLVRPAKQCIVCDKTLAKGDIIEFKREGLSFSPLKTHLTDTLFIAGTGFAGGGMAETSKTGIAFQG